MARTSKSRGATPFTMKSGNSSAFKMMGSSPMRIDPKTLKELNTGSVGLVPGGTEESLITRDQKASEAQNSKGNIKIKLEETYPGTTWSKEPTKENPKGVWVTSDGRLLKDM
tara:strand:+ start:222 stop:557 length:336 start_codon:yes stop_codon:yes gene_type:complete